jgi:hypothetical protein
MSIISFWRVVKSSQCERLRQCVTAGWPEEAMLQQRMLFLAFHRPAGCVRNPGQWQWDLQRNKQRREILQRSFGSPGVRYLHG